MTLSDPATIMQWLQEIEEDLAERGNEFAEKAGAFFRGKRNFELALAKAYIGAEGSNQKERESNALTKVEALPVYDEFVTAEAEYHALKSVLGVLDTRATICQSLLKIHSREAQYGNS